MIGMTPEEAILTATRNSAKALGRLDDMGTLEQGKVGDLIVVDGDPLRRIEALQNLENVKLVVKDGVIEADRR
jgi:imidazolonepropionase-like amidohydrolase